MQPPAILQAVGLLKYVFKAKSIGLRNIFTHSQQNFNFGQGAFIIMHVDISHRLIQLIINFQNRGVGQPNMQGVFPVFPKFLCCSAVLISDLPCFRFIVKRSEDAFKFAKRGTDTAIFPNR